MVIYHESSIVQKKTMYLYLAKLSPTSCMRHKLILKWSLNSKFPFFSGFDTMVKVTCLHYYSSIVVRRTMYVPFSSVLAQCKMLTTVGCSFVVRFMQPFTQQSGNFHLYTSLCASIVFSMTLCHLLSYSLSSVVISHCFLLLPAGMMNENATIFSRTHLLL